MNAHPTARDRVVVTGGAGFIGSALVERLVRDGERVVVIDNLVNGKRSNLAHLPADKARLIAVDIRAPQKFSAELQAAHTVFHLACLGLRHSLHSPTENHNVNAGGTLTLLEAAFAAAVPRFVHVSSSEVYGTALSSPMGEDHPTRPITVYGAAKLAGEAYATAFHHAHGLKVTIVRPFNSYGPRCHHEGDAGEVVPKFMLRALAGRPLIVFGTGEQTRDFTYVADTAAGIAAARCDAAIGKTINLGSGTAIPILDVARAIGRVTGRSIRIVHEASRPGDLMALCADARLAQQLFDFTPAVAFEEGLARLNAWYRGLAWSPERLLDQEVEQNWRAGGEIRHVG
ncbi:MAG TPA: SDR family NAD(P)-dependent oxidoreductase [Xanthobacteraceae bacterium]|nr:SDR family NAD(P)-dependent oxidoreductase [Xanthobacteraceae bacterium]